MIKYYFSVVDATPHYGIPFGPNPEHNAKVLFTGSLHQCFKYFQARGITVGWLQDMLHSHEYRSMARFYFDADGTNFVVVAGKLSLGPIDFD